MERTKRRAFFLFVSRMSSISRSTKNWSISIVLLMLRMFLAISSSGELRMASDKEAYQTVEEEHVYRISTLEEWETFQKTGSMFGGELDKTTGCIHLSKISQVQPVLRNFFLDVKSDLYLLQIDAKKLGDGLVYEVGDNSNVFPHFYGPSRSFSALPLDAVVKVEKLILSDGKYTCSLLS